MTELSKCPRGGTRYRVACPKCRRHTHWHRPNGGELQEWREIAEGAES